MPQLIEKDACDLLDADHVAVKHLFVEYARLAVAGKIRYLPLKLNLKQQLQTKTVLKLTLKILKKTGSHHG